MGPWGPLREEGVSPLGLAAKGGAHPPYGRHTPPPWEFSPTWGRGGGSRPPLAYIRRGSPPFSNTPISPYSSLPFPEVDSPCLESAPGLEFSTIRQAVVLLESGFVAVFISLLAWFGAREEHRLYRTCIISSRHYTCGATSSLEVYRESSSSVVVFYTTGRL